jgi:hypothetical protein
MFMCMCKSYYISNVYAFVHCIHANDEALDNLYRCDYVCTFIYVYMRKWRLLAIYIYIYIYIHTHTHTHTYIHTYACTRLQELHLHHEQNQRENDIYRFLIADLRRGLLFKINKSTNGAALPPPQEFTVINMIDKLRHFRGTSIFKVFLHMYMQMC